MKTGTVTMVDMAARTSPKSKRKRKSWAAGALGEWRREEQRLTRLSGKRVKP